MICQPEFVTETVFENAKTSMAKKKLQLDLSKARWMCNTEDFVFRLCIKVLMMITCPIPGGVQWNG